MNILYHLIVILGICMVYEGILPLFFTETWQARMKYWANTSSETVQRYALNLVVIGLILVLIPTAVKFL